MGDESDFIDWIAQRQRAGGHVVAAAGDDLAILDLASDRTIVVGADQVLDGVHFDSKIHPPRKIGRKAMNRNLSDCAAMAAWPIGATVTFALPRATPMEFVRELYLGIEEAGAAFACPIVGGDTGSWDGPLAVSVAILGRPMDGPSISDPANGKTDRRAALIRRGGARPGDALFVTGALGGSILSRHLEFVPRLQEAKVLAAGGKVHAMIDISDGLSRDVRHLCRESGIGVEIDAAAVPIHADVRQMKDSASPLEHALNDGEDHELLFAAAQDFAGPGFAIGRFIAEPGVWLIVDGRRTPLRSGGWEHRW